MLVCKTLYILGCAQTICHCLVWPAHFGNPPSHFLLLSPSPSPPHPVVAAPSRSQLHALSPPLLSPLLPVAAAPLLPPLPVASLSVAAGACRPRRSRRRRRRLSWALPVVGAPCRLRSGYHHRLHPALRAATLTRRGTPSGEKARKGERGPRGGVSDGHSKSPLPLSIDSFRAPIHPEPHRTPARCVRQVILILFLYLLTMCGGGSTSTSTGGGTIIFKFINIYILYYNSYSYSLIVMIVLNSALKTRG